MNSEILKLKNRRDELQKQLSDPEILCRPQKVKELSIEYGKITKELETGDKRIEQEFDSPNIIMEIRAGAGGKEAALFAKKLFEMYAHFADKRAWELIILNESKSELGGYKEAVFEVNGQDAYKMLRWESGVHRVQRIPETEKSGRVHTSTASVAVLPQAREIDIEIKPQDIKIEFFRSSGPGGQNVNKVETAVRIHHLSSGLIVTSQESRSQQKNRERAFTLLRTKLLDAKIREGAKKIAVERRQQIGTGDRSEKIRTYNFPQDRVTDHRIKKSWHNIESIMAGNLEPVVETLQNPVNILSQR